LSPMLKAHRKEAMRGNGAELRDPTNFSVRTTHGEWEWIKSVAEDCGNTLAVFVNAAVESWLDPSVDIPRYIHMPPSGSIKRAVQVERDIVRRAESATLLDREARPLSLHRSDVVMSAILSYAQAYMDENPLLAGRIVADAARPALEAKLAA